MRGCLILLVVFGMVSVSFGREKSCSLSRKDRFVQYLSGVHLLRSAVGWTEEEKAAFYRQLVRLTGLGSEEARAFMSAYRNRPEAWEKIIDGVVDTTQRPKSPEEE